MQGLQLYTTTNRFYITGSVDGTDRYHVLIISRTRPGQVCAEELPTVFSWNELQVYIQNVQRETAVVGPRSFAAILGLIRLPSLHLVIVTQTRRLGLMASQYVYGIEDFEILPLCDPQFAISHGKYMRDHRYLQLFESVKLRRDFYFSYAYDVTRSVQNNCLATGTSSNDPSSGDKQQDVPMYEPSFVWNLHMARELISSVPSYWVVALVQGYFKQNAFEMGQRLTLLCRRSRYQAGPRFIKRGVNRQGRVANEVETEQIVDDEAGVASYVMQRGSIPLFWSQQTHQELKKSFRPEIVIDPKRNENHGPTEKHFQGLLKRAGGCERTIRSLFVLNLVRQKTATQKITREAELGYAFRDAVIAVHSKLSGCGVEYFAYDLLECKRNKRDVKEDLTTLLQPFASRQGYFSYTKGSSAPQKLQIGQVRVNCVDCLDRTNVAQYVLGKQALNRQLVALGMMEDGESTEDNFWAQSIASKLKESFSEHGDMIAIQYAGSHALHKEVLDDNANESMQADAEGEPVVGDVSRAGDQPSSWVKNLRVTGLQSKATGHLQKFKRSSAFKVTKKFGQNVKEQWGKVGKDIIDYKRRASKKPANGDYSGMGSSSVQPVRELLDETDDLDGTMDLLELDADTDDRAKAGESRGGGGVGVKLSEFKRAGAGLKSNVFSSVQRGYNNAFNDAKKQQALNVFLGYFVPRPGKPFIGDLPPESPFNDSASMYPNGMHEVFPLPCLP